MFQSAKSFFESFSHDYLVNEKDNHLFQKKYDHTYRVVEYTKKIAESLGWDSKKQELACTIAIFHDLGRFVQAKQFKRFRDAQDDFDHAMESVQILKRQDWFCQNNISKEDEDIICFAIFYHNKLSLPQEDSVRMELAKLIRDTDKLDNLKTISCTEDLETNPMEKKILPENLESYFHNQCLLKKNQISALDHVLLQICFIYDFNYDESVRFCFEEQLFEPYFAILKQYLDHSLYLKMRKHFDDYVASVFHKKCS